MSISVKRILLALLAVSVFSSCCSTKLITQRDQKLIDDPERLIELSKNVVKITSYHNISIYDTNDPNKKSKLLAGFDVTAVGTGVLVKRQDELSIVLTAGHLCTPVPDAQLKSYFPKLTKDNFIIDNSYHGVSNVNGQDFMALMITYNASKDICLLVSNAPIEQELIIAKNIRRYEPVFYQGFVLGLYGKNFVPVFEGKFIGIMDTWTGELAQTYVMRVTNGASGSPIFNNRGELVGIVSSFLRNFDSISMSSTIENINEIIKDAEQMIITRQVSPEGVDGGT